MSTKDRPIVILSLGAGVQSSALALMAAHREVAPFPDAAIFADTGAEPQAVYDWLDWLEKKLPFPVSRVTGGDLGSDFLRALSVEGSRCGQPPFYVKNAPDDPGGMLWRQCTKEYKLAPIRKEARRLMEARGAKRVEQWVGISYDEMQRMKESGVKYIENRFPLVEMRMDRQACKKWMAEHGYPEPPRSACVWCPYIHNDRWRWMKEKQPEEFERACQFDEKIRDSRGTKMNGAGITGEMFVHRSCKPLREAVLTDADLGQATMDFNAECDGMCGT